MAVISVGWKLAIVGGLSLPGTSALAQSGPGCNDTTRQADIIGGTYNTTTHSCASLTLTVTILGQEGQVQTPPTCTNGGISYAGTIYKCEGELEGVFCWPQGYKVNYDAFSAENNCPAPPPTLAFDSAEEAAQYLQCKGPATTTSSFDWSAQARRCPTSGPITEEGSLHGLSAGTGDDPAMFWELGLDEAVTSFGSPSEVLRPWLHSAPLDPATAHPAIQWLLGGQENVEAVDLSVAVTWTAPGASLGRDVVIDGTWSADGRFDVVEREAALGPGGEPALLETEVAFDGATLSVRTVGAPDALAWLPGSARAESAFRREAFWAPMIMSWLTHPFGIDHADDPTWAVVSDPSQGDRLSRMSHGIEQQLLLDPNDPTRVVGMRKVSLGVPYRAADFRDVVELGDETARPAHTRLEIEVGDPAGPVTIELDVRRAVSLEELPAGFGRVASPSGRWLLRY